jgi:hypothetical protein
VDVDARLVEAWTPNATPPTIVDDTLVWQPDQAAPALTIELGECFREIWDEAWVRTDEGDRSAWLLHS